MLERSRQQQQQQQRKKAPSLFHSFAEGWDTAKPRCVMMMTQTRELTIFSVHGCSVGSHLLCFHSCHHLNRQYTKYYQWHFSHFGQRLLTLSMRCCGAQKPFFFLLPWWTAFFFKIFFLQFFSLPDCFSNMQNQANCLSVNIICDFSCTYTFYVLSDWVNGDSKTDSCCSMISKKKEEEEMGGGGGKKKKIFILI